MDKTTIPNALDSARIDNEYWCSFLELSDINYNEGDVQRAILASLNQNKKLIEVAEMLNHEVEKLMDYVGKISTKDGSGL